MSYVNEQMVLILCMNMSISSYLKNNKEINIMYTCRLKDVCVWGLPTFSMADFDSPCTVQRVGIQLWVAR